MRSNWKYIWIFVRLNETEALNTQGFLKPMFWWNLNLIFYSAPIFLSYILKGEKHKVMMQAYF